MNEYQALAYYAAAHPEKVVLISIGLRYAPSLTLSLGKEYIRNTVRYFGSNVKSTAKVLVKEFAPGRRGVPKGRVTKFRVPRIGGPIALLAFYPEIRSVYDDPSVVFQPGGAYGEDHSGGWFFGVPVEAPDWL